MLKLKRVELQGFKSFPERTELRFNGSGIAAVVGPNGCGKSNIADAINWVLGEQSAKSMRGARMEDVIFAGSRDRKPLGLAAVTMTLAHPEQFVPAAKTNGTNGAANGSGANGANGTNGVAKVNGHANGAAVNGSANGKAEEADPDVVVTRRLFRSGESEYLINGRPARLRDIQDIFMGTGLGPESYAIIEQGRIGQLLSSRPQDRRAVLEEASGISKFKTRRKLAEARLEGAKHNLERVFDILEEVGRQVNSLKRQAAKAKRYEELKAELTGHLRRVLAGRYQMLERETAKIALDLNVAAAAVEKLTSEAAQKEQEYSRSQQEHYDTETRLTDARKVLAELNLELERTRGRLESQSRQVGSIEQRVTQSEKDSQDLDTRLARYQEELVSHSEAGKRLDIEAEDARGRLEAKHRDREAARVAVEQRERALEGARQTVLRLLGEAGALRNQLTQIDTYLASIERDVAKAQREEQAAAADIERLNAAKEQLSQKRSAQQLDLENITAQRRRYEEELSVRKGQLSGARRELETVRAEFSRTKARRDSLEEVISHRSYTTESVKRLFTAIEKGQARDLKPLGVLADFVEVDSSYEKAAEEFLHEELEYIVVSDWNQAESGIELMRSGSDGRATFLVHAGPEQAPEQPARREPAVGEETGVTARLRDVLRLTNGFSSSSIEILPRVARGLLARDRAAAQQLAPQFPDLYFLTPDGLCYHGQSVSGGKKSSSGPLALKRELRDLKAQVQAHQKKLDATSARIEELERDISELEHEIERLRGIQQSREKEAVAIDHEMRKVAEELARANSRLSVAKNELARLGREKETSAVKREANLRAVEDKDRIRTQQEEALQSAREEVEKLKKDSARVVEEHSALRVQLAELEERRRAERNVISRLEQQIKEAGTRRQQIASEVQRLSAEKSRLVSSNAELDQRALELAAQIASSDAEVSRLAERETAGRARLAELEEALKTLRAQAQEAQEKKSQTELDLVKHQSELKFLDETSRKELNVSVAELSGSEETVLDDEALAEADRRCQEIRSRIDSLGPVNPQALEEHKEAQQRYDFLNAQRQDLLDSIRDTERAIQDIDVESRKRFTEAFAAINANFRDLFVTLFGGGMCEMRLTDADNVAESGIDIVASPPGKRLQNVLLLSGGEKALTALALLMAIFKYQPSPFCILDEVDAPLDEPNIERLTRLIKEMSAQTQFIIITHSKRTMESAQMLYGVTMQEPGVSRLVSVKFNQIQPLPTPSPLEIARM